VCEDSLFLGYPKKYKVELLNDMKNHCRGSPCTGMYLLQSKKVNGLPHWLQQNGKYAIWYDDESTKWKLGSDLGSTKAVFLTDQDKLYDLPHEIRWKFHDGKWTFSDDIVVTPTAKYVQLPGFKRKSDRLETLKYKMWSCANCGGFDMEINIKTCTNNNCDTCTFYLGEKDSGDTGTIAFPQKFKALVSHTGYYRPNCKTFSEDHSWDDDSPTFKVRQTRSK
jgi:hypothetical protein